MPGKSAITILEEDHMKMKKLMSEIDETTERALKTRPELIEKMKHDLTIHERIEEEVFYPALKTYKKATDIVLEAYEEHHAVNMLLDELESVAFDDETWGAKFTVIMENIEHHIEEEEEDLFIKARQLLTAEELADLGEQMLALQEQLTASANA